jgi:hypothetical protein
LRTGAGLGLFATLFPDPTTIAAATNAFISNAQQLGLSAEETERQLKKLAATSGVTLITGLEEMNRKFLEGDINEKILKAGTAGLVELFEEDLPAGVDAAALAIENFSEQGGLDIANFTEDMEDAVEVFGRLQATAEAGIGGAAFAGIGGQVGAYRAYDRFMGGYGSLGDVNRAARDAQESFISGLYEAALGGGAEAITTLATQEIQKLPEYDAFLDALAEAVKPGGGGLGDLPFRIQDLADAASESIDAAAQTMQAFQDAFSVTPTALREQAQSIEQSIEDFRFGLLTPRQQSQQLHRRVAELEAELATTTDPVRRQEILSELAGLGFDIAQLAQARGLRGNAFKREVNYGLGVSERAGTGLESMADRPPILGIVAPVATTIETSAETIATSNNTLVRALHRLTVVIESAPQSIDINVPAGRTINDEQLERVILRLIDRSPRVRKRVQQGAGLG